MAQSLDHKADVPFGGAEVLQIAIEDLFSRFDISDAHFSVEGVESLIQHTLSLSSHALKQDIIASQILSAASLNGVMGATYFAMELVTADASKFSALLEAPDVPDIERLTLLTPLAALARARLKVDMFSESRLERLRAISEMETTA